MDRIRLAGIRAYGRHGVTALERAAEQPFDVDLTVECDLTAASHTDEIGATIDYARLHERIVATVANTSYALIERLARAILDAVLEDERIVRAEATVAKPNALEGATPSVTIARANDRHR